MKNLQSSYNEIINNIEGLVNQLVIDERMCEECHECYDSKTTPLEAKEQQKYICSHCWNFDPLKRENDRINDAFMRGCDEAYDEYCACGGAHPTNNGVCADCK